MNIYAIYNVISPYFRNKRLKSFLQTFQPSSSTSILDVGGYPWCWSVKVCPSRMTFLNLDFPPELGGTIPPQYSLVKADARKLPYPDQSFDIGYSNSVVEHLGTYESQEAFSREIRRVAKRLWVQTPARWFPVETHLLTPLIHYLPKRWQRPFLRYFTVWGWLTRPTQKQVDDFLAEIRLLTYSEMQKLFPDCRIRRERFLGFTKSFIAVR